MLIQADVAEKLRHEIKQIEEIPEYQTKLRHTEFSEYTTIQNMQGQTT